MWDLIEGEPNLITKIGTMTATNGESYRSWGVVAGYFDEDGAVEFSVRQCRIETRLAFDDNWKPLLEGLWRFLTRKSIVSGSVRRKQQSQAWHLVVSHRRSVIQMAKAMLPYVVKKRKELVAVVEYLEGRSTGKDFVQVMNQEVISGQRTGKLRIGAPDFTHEEGVSASRFRGEFMRRRRRLTPISKNVAQQILHDRIIRGLKYKQLSAKYGYTRWVLRRVIRDGFPSESIVRRA